MKPSDDDLLKFEAEGATLPTAGDQGYIEHDGARIWYATYGAGSPVLLLHGGLGHSGNWGYQVPALVESGYRVIVIDSRGHGRSTRDDRPYSYELMASDVLAVMDALQVEKTALVGWSDGACTALVLASKAPERIAGVFFFACNMDPSGTKAFDFTPIVQRCFSRHVKDYKQLSPTPNDFETFSEAVGLMQRTQPNYSGEDLAAISVPVTIVHSEHDEFIKQEHAEYLARNIPNAEFILLPEVSHFAPLQRPEVFNQTILAFLGHQSDHVRIGSIVIRCFEHARMVRFWQAALHYVIGHTDEGFVILKDPRRKGPNVSIDQTPARRTGKRSWIHLDLYTPDQTGEVERLVALGAKRYPWRYEPHADYVVLEDPDGNLFCVVQE